VSFGYPPPPPHTENNSHRAEPAFPKGNSISSSSSTPRWVQFPASITQNTTQIFGCVLGTPQKTPKTDSGTQNTSRDRRSPRCAFKGRETVAADPAFPLEPYRGLGAIGSAGKSRLRLVSGTKYRQHNRVGRTGGPSLRQATPLRTQPQQQATDGTLSRRNSGSGLRPVPSSGQLVGGQRAAAAAAVVAGHEAHVSKLS